MSRKLLDDLTEEEYFRLRKELEYDEHIANELFVSIYTLQNWKKANKVYSGRKGNFKSRMSTEQRIKLYKALTVEGMDRDRIATRLKLKDRKTLNTRLSQWRKQGYDV